MPRSTSYNSRKRGGGGIKTYPAQTSCTRVARRITYWGKGSRGKFQVPPPGREHFGPRRAGPDQRSSTDLLRPQDTPKTHIFCYKQEILEHTKRKHKPPSSPTRSSRAGARAARPRRASPGGRRRGRNMPRSTSYNSRKRGGGCVKTYPAQTS
jgi:hypothetical protein